MQLEQHHVDRLTQQLDAVIHGLDIVGKRLATPYYRPPAQQAVAGASGFATIAFENFPGGVDKLWLVEKVFVYTNSVNTPIVCGVFVMDGLPAGMTRDNANQYQQALNPLYQKDATNFAIAGGDEITPIVVKGGETLLFQWSGLSSAALCVASFQYKLAWQAQP